MVVLTTQFERKNRKEWLEKRQSGVTASDVAALFGISPFKSKLELYLEKKHNLQPQVENKAIIRGRWLEATALTALQEEKPDLEIKPAKNYYREEKTRLGATPDFITKDGIVVEVKALVKRSFDEK